MKRNALAFAVVGLSFVLTGQSSAELRLETAERIERLALGSCAKQDLEQPIWDAIAAADPQLFVFLGDTIYADTEDMEKMRTDYEMLASDPAFGRFRDRVPFLATWDDHDYGANDAGAEYPKKVESQRLFLDFFDEPADSPRRAREGVYHSWTFGPEGQRVQILLLDGRTFRSALVRDPNIYRRYQPDLDPKKTLLGEEQWSWLEQELRKPAEIRLIGSAIPLLGYSAHFEGWKNLPLEQERLFQMLRETEAEGVVVLSGDAHFAQIKRGDAGLGYPLYELQASGLTHGNAQGVLRPSPLALHPPYGGLNFGTIEIDWERTDPVIELRARDRDGNPVLSREISLSELRPWWKNQENPRPAD